MRPDSHPAAELKGKGLRYVSHTLLAFIAFSLILSLNHWRVERVPDMWIIHAGLLQDLAAEWPIGRQALVSSLAVMPLTSLAALPFLPLLQPAAYGFAYFYGLALLLAVAVVPLRGLLASWGLGRARAVAPLALALAAFLLGSTEWSDLLACLAMLILALYVESRALPELRALAGVFWALVLFAHVAGLILVALRFGWVAVSRARGRGQPEARAVQAIQGTTVLYGFGVYLFLNWMIMGSALYPLATASCRWPGRDTDACRKQLALLLAREYSDCRPVVSGLWGYAIQPLLNTTEGYHVVDFHPRKLPPDEAGSLVLVLPAPGNPFATMNDVKPGSIKMNPDFAAPPVIASTPDWTFVRMDMKPVESE